MPPPPRNEDESLKVRPDLWYPYYVQAFVADTLDQPDYIVGQYQRLLNFYWINRCAGIEDKESRMRQICQPSCDSHWESAKPELFGRYFKLGEDGKWFQKRMKQERDKAENHIAKKSKAGKEGARVRWNSKTIAIVLALALALALLPRDSSGISNRITVASKNDSTSMHLYSYSYIESPRGYMAISFSESQERYFSLR